MSILLPRQVSIALPSQPPAATRFLVRTIAGGDIQELTVAEVQALVGGGGGGGQVNTVVSGTGVTVNSVDPINPIVNLSAGTLTSLGKADTAVQPGSLAAVATSGAYADLSGKPSLATVATSGAYGDLTGRPTLATVATTGAYADLTGKPTLAAVALSGAYADLTGTPAIPAGANRTALSGMTVVQGVATTFARSDSATAIDPAITPTWTGNHFWAKTDPRLVLSDTSQGTDLKLFGFINTGGSLIGRTRTDADGTGQNWIAVARGATTAIGSISVSNATDNNPFNFLGTGLITSGGNIKLSKVEPRILLSDTSGGADGKLFDIDATPTFLSIRTRTDADGAGAQILGVNRTASSTAITGITLGNATNNNSLTIAGTGTVTVQGKLVASFAGTNGTNASIDIDNTSPALGMRIPGGAADGRVWDTALGNTTFNMRAVNDANNSVRNWLSVSRTSNSIAITGISLGDATGNPIFNFLGTGLVSIGGDVTLTNAAPRLRFNESDAGADLKFWDSGVNAGILTRRTRTDADGAGQTFETITRGSTTNVTSLQWNTTGGFAPAQLKLDSQASLFLETTYATGDLSFDVKNNSNAALATSSIDLIAGTGANLVNAIYTSFNATASMLSQFGAPAPATGGVAFMTSTGAAALNATIMLAPNTVPGLIMLGDNSLSTFYTPLSVNGSLTLLTAGNGIAIKEGANATSGIATLVGGTVVVNTTKVTANSRIQLTGQNLGTVAVPSGYSVSARTPGTSFTILASAPTDTSNIAWTIIEPAP